MTRWLMLQANPNISRNAYARLRGRLSDHRDRSEIVPGRTSLKRRVIAPPGRIRSGGGGDRRRAIWPARLRRAQAKGSRRAFSSPRAGAPFAPLSLRVMVRSETWL